MEAKAVAKYVRISPQKARLAVDLIRGKKVEDAERILNFTRKKAETNGWLPFCNYNVRIIETIE